MTAPTAAAAASASLTASSAEQDGIRRAIDCYVEGLRAGSVDTLKQGFHPQAIMSGYLGETVMMVPIQGLYDFVTTHPAPATSGEPFSADLVSIEVSGNTATAEIAEHFYQGFDFRTCFHLMKVDRRWQIVSKLFNALGPSR